MALIVRLQRTSDDARPNSLVIKAQSCLKFNSELHEWPAIQQRSSQFAGKRVRSKLTASNRVHRAERSNDCRLGGNRATRRSRTEHGEISNVARQTRGSQTRQIFPQVPGIRVRGGGGGVRGQGVVYVRLRPMTRSWQREGARFTGETR